jgi:hypothetical protein
MFWHIAPPYSSTGAEVWRYIYPIAPGPQGLGHYSGSGGWAWVPCLGLEPLTGSEVGNRALNTPSLYYHGDVTIPFSLT